VCSFGNEHCCQKKCWKKNIKYLHDGMNCLKAFKAKASAATSVAAWWCFIFLPTLKFIMPMVLLSFLFLSLTIYSFQSDECYFYQKKLFSFFFPIVPMYVCISLYQQDFSNVYLTTTNFLFFSILLLSHPHSLFLLHFLLFFSSQWLFAVFIVSSTCTW
jgi:hypothetical protein